MELSPASLKFMVAGDVNFALLRNSEPAGAIGDPPGGHGCWNRREERPPKGKREVGDQSESSECQPEDFALHEASLAK